MLSVGIATKYIHYFHYDCIRSLDFYLTGFHVKASFSPSSQLMDVRVDTITVISRNIHSEQMRVVTKNCLHNDTAIYYSTRDHSWGNIAHSVE